jgi:hypothetical protein
MFWETRRSKVMMAKQSLIDVETNNAYLEYLAKEAVSESFIG